MVEPVTPNVLPTAERRFQESVDYAVGCFNRSLKQGSTRFLEGDQDGTWNPKVREEVIARFGRAGWEIHVQEFTDTSHLWLFVPAGEGPDLADAVCVRFLAQEGRPVIANTCRALAFP